MWRPNITEKKEPDPQLCLNTLLWSLCFQSSAALGTKVTITWAPLSPLSLSWLCLWAHCSIPQVVCNSFTDVSASCKPFSRNLELQLKRLYSLCLWSKCICLHLFRLHLGGSYLKILVSFGSSTSVIFFQWGQRCSDIFLSFYFSSWCVNICISIPIVQFIGRCPGLFLKTLLSVLTYSFFLSSESNMKNLNLSN